MAMTKGPFRTSFRGKPRNEPVDEEVKSFDPPLDVFGDVEKKPKVVKDKAKVKVRCPDCPWKPGLTNEGTLCEKCNGSGQVLADPLE